MATRLKKSTKEKKLFGVCGGFATYFGWDPTIVRILFLILALTTAGTMVIVYLVMALVMPSDQNE